MQKQIRIQEWITIFISNQSHKRWPTFCYCWYGVDINAGPCLQCPHGASHKQTCSSVTWRRRPTTLTSSGGQWVIVTFVFAGLSWVIHAKGPSINDAIFYLPNRLTPVTFLAYSTPHPHLFLGSPPQKKNLHLWTALNVYNTSSFTKDPWVKL